MEVRIRNKTGCKSLYKIFEENTLLGLLPRSILFSLSINMPKLKKNNIDEEYDPLFPPKSNNSIEKSFELDDSEYDELLKKIKKYSWERLLKYLTQRDRSRYECFQYLHRLPLGKSLIDDMLDLAESYNFINDHRFTEFYVRSSIASGKNIKETRFKLKQKRIKDNIIEDILQEFYSSDIEKQVLQANIEKLLRRFSGYEFQKKKDKILSILARKGFRYSEIIDTLNRCISEDKSNFEI